MCRHRIWLPKEAVVFVAETIGRSDDQRVWARIFAARGLARGRSQSQLLELRCVDMDSVDVPVNEEIQARTLSLHSKRKSAVLFSASTECDGPIWSGQ